MRIPTMQPQQGMSELPRGQHPHAITPFMRDNGPATWNNKHEIDRWDWDERFVPGREDGNPDGNPIAQYGMGLQPRDDVEASLEAATSRAKNWWPNVPEYNKPRTPPKAPPKPAQPSTSLWGGDEQYTPAAMKAAAGTPKTGSPSSSKMKAPGAKSPSPTTKKIFFTDQGVVTSKQRELRMNQLSSKLGVDKVQLVSSPIQIDTTAPAGHNTAPVAPSPTGAGGVSTSTMRGGAWPATDNYWARASPPRKPPPRLAHQAAARAQQLRASA